MRGSLGTEISEYPHIWLNHNQLGHFLWVMHNKCAYSCAIAWLRGGRGELERGNRAEGVGGCPSRGSAAWWWAGWGGASGYAEQHASDAQPPRYLDDWLLHMHALVTHCRRGRGRRAKALASLNITLPLSPSLYTPLPTPFQHDHTTQRHSVLRQIFNPPAANAEGG